MMRPPTPVVVEIARLVCGTVLALGFVWLITRMLTGGPAGQVDRADPDPDRLSPRWLERHLAGLSTRPAGDAPPTRPATPPSTASAPEPGVLLSSFHAGSVRTRPNATKIRAGRFTR